MTTAPRLSAEPASLERVRTALEGLGMRFAPRARPDDFQVQCPAHSDRTPSLHVSWKPSRGQGGYVLLCCMGCRKPAAEIVAALGLTVADLFDQPPERRADGRRVGRPLEQRRSGARRGKLGRLPTPIAARAGQRDQEPEPTHQWQGVATYSYIDLNAALVEEVVREECSACAARHKRFRQVFLDQAGRRVRRKPEGFTPVLYRLPELVEAIASGRRVWLVEGEKDVESAERAGEVATTNAQGGHAFPDELAAVFVGAEVGVVLDRDDTGWVRGVSLHRQLTNAGATSVGLYLPATTAAKSDLTDHLEAGFDFEQLVPVSLEAVSAWATLTTVLDKHTGVEQGLAETQAHLAGAELAGRDNDAEAGELHTRHATRWAQEAEVRYFQLRGLVDDLAHLAAAAGDAWADEALQLASDAQQRSEVAARTALEMTNLPVPPPLQERQQAPPITPPPVETRSAATHTPRRLRAVPDGIEHPIYQVLDGCIVQIEKRRSRDGASEWDAIKLVLGLDVRIVEIEQLEDPDVLDVEQPHLSGRTAREAMAQLNPPAPPVISAVVVAYTDPLTGEEMRLRVPGDDYDKFAWLQSLPGPPAHDSRPSGLAKVRDAIRDVSAGSLRHTVRHRSTGWRHDQESGQWRYVHAGGAIGADGVHPTPVLLSGPLARYDLPDPCLDPPRIRQAFLDDSAALLTKLPGRVGAPLLGQVWRAALGPTPSLVALVGPPGSYKTSIASLAMHHWGELWDRRKPASSMSGNGDTLNAIRIKLNAAKDALYWADDFAPTKDWGAAQKALEEFARLLYNGEHRSRSTRDGQAVLDGTPPQCSGLATSEVLPRPGSGAQRIMVIPLVAGEVDIDTLIALDSYSSRHGRALLVASLLRWLAADLPGRRAEFLAEGERYASQIRGRGETVRQAEAVGQIWAGWTMMTSFLTDVEALSADEVTQLLRHVDECLTQAIAATCDPDMPAGTGARVRELLAHALRTGLAYVDDVRTGDAPPWPMAGRLGWRRVQIGMDEHMQPKYRPEARGIRLGYVLQDPGPHDGPAQVLVESTALEQVLKAAAAQMTDGLQLDRTTAVRALYDEGVLIAEQRAGRTPRYTVQRTLHCEQARRARVTALRLAELLGDEPEQPQLPGGPTGPGDDGPPDRGATVLPFLNPHDDVDSSQRHEFDWTSPAAQGPTSPGSEEQVAMRHPDAEGHEADSSYLPDSAPCLICGQGAAVSFEGHAMHIPCWWGSTAVTRAAALGARLSGHAEPALSKTDTAAGHATRPGTTGGRPAAATPPTGFAAPAAVLHTDGVWLPDGTCIELAEQPRHVGDLAALVTQLSLGTTVTRWRTDPGQLWITDAALAALGIDPLPLREAKPHRRVEAVREATRGAELVTAAAADGWQLGGDGSCLSAWTRVWRGEMRGVWIAIIAAMDTDPLAMPMLADDPEPATLARRLSLLAGALHTPWTLSGSTTGFNLATALRWKDREKVFAVYEPVPPAAIATLENDLDWSRKPTAEERKCRYVHAYDRGGSYAAGLAGLELGIGEAIHHATGREFDPKSPGYWRFEVPEQGDWRLPYLLKPTGKPTSLPAQPVWGTTPTLQLAYELGYEVPILEAYTWSEHARVLDSWYEHIRDARSALDTSDPQAQLAREQLKVIYTRTIGMMGSAEYMAGRPGYGPERRHHIIAKARSNIMRRILQIGRDADRWPIAALADTLLYVSDDPDPVSAWPGKPDQLGRGFGQYKPEASGLLADQLRYLAGDGWRGKEQLDRDWKVPKGPDGTEAVA